LLSTKNAGGDVLQGRLQELALLESELHKIKKDQRVQKHHYEKMKMIFKKNQPLSCGLRREDRNRSTSAKPDNSNS